MFPIIAAISAFMLVLVAVMYVRDVFVAKRSVTNLGILLVEMRMRPFANYKDNRKRQQAITRAEEQLKRGKEMLAKRNWTVARMSATTGAVILKDIS